MCIKSRKGFRYDFHGKVSGELGSNRNLASQLLTNGRRLYTINTDCMSKRQCDRPSQLSVLSAALSLLHNFNYCQGQILGAGGLAPSKFVLIIIL